MKKILLFLCLLPAMSFCQVLLVHHTTNYFGPNANPVPEFTGALIPKETQLEIVGDYYFGFGDYTLSNLVRVEIALIPKKVSVKAWKTTLEKYNFSDEILVRRNMQETDGTASGDLYVQTWVRLLKESQYWPDIDANATLKTASGTTFEN